MAITCAGAGEKDLAVKQLKQALQLLGPISYGQLRLQSWWDSLRSDARFEKIVADLAAPKQLSSR